MVAGPVVVQMVESVLNMADYQTFSAMMRVRASQMRKLRDAEAVAKKRHEQIRERGRILSSADTTPEQFVEQFDSLRSRICELTPKRDDLRVRAPTRMVAELTGLSDNAL